MNEPTELDLAELKHEFRQLYQHVGFAGAIQVLYELMVSAKVFAEIILEERQKEKETE